MEQRHRSSPYRPFAISVERSRDEVAVVPVGELDLACADRLGQEVRQLRAAGCAQIVLDLRQVDFIDSTGLRILLTLRNDARRKEHALTLVPPAPVARRIFELTGTRGLFDWRIDRAEPWA
jgi:anti-sigma B factor antagonist